jgi:uroporphyrinogen-III decarboxylase
MGTILADFDPNAYCPGHITGRDIHTKIIAFPQNFVTEAESLGAKTNKTLGGFETVRVLFNKPGELYQLPNLARGGKAKEVIRRIKETLEPTDDTLAGVLRGKTVLLKVNGPYSILASLVEPRLFYRWLGKERCAVHAALEKITTGLGEYIQRAVNAGAEIISLADPYANVKILGEKYFLEFAACPLLDLLNFISPAVNSAEAEKKVKLHICPHNSVPLLELGRFKKEETPVEYVSYISALLDWPHFRKGLTITGGECIYSRNIKKLSFLLYN